jgi:hypothetical protein
MANDARADVRENNVALIDLQALSVSLDQAGGTILALPVCRRATAYPLGQRGENLLGRHVAPTGSGFSRLSEYFSRDIRQQKEMALDIRP